MLSAWIDTVARSHVVLVHFPIAFLLGAALLALFERDDREHGARACLALGAAGALAAAVTGWLLAERTGFGAGQERTLFQHRWTGVVTATLAVGAWRLARRGRSRSLAVALGLCVAGVSLTGHLGGTLVHGPGYLLGARPDEGAPEPEPRGAEAHESTHDAAVRALVESRCLRCHGPRRARAGLRLDLVEDLLADPAQRIVVPGRPQESELLRRVSLPAEHEDVMPAQGEPLSTAEVQLLRDWIAGLPVNDAPTAGGGAAVPPDGR